MTFAFSLRLWKPFRTSRRRVRSAKKPAALTRSLRPRLEVLEDRTLPSSFTVTNLNDSGSGSLRAEVAAANAASGATINFAQGLHGTITLTSGELGITSSMTISGPGANKLTVSGNNASRVFDISNNATANISGLTIANGATISTGENSATVDVTALGGGGILNQSGSTLNLSNSVLANNTATASSDTVDVFGGGLLNEGAATITSSLFCGNQALGGGGTSFFGGSVGGAIDNFGGATLTVSGSTFTNNQALAAGPGGFGIGGALESNAGLDDSSPSTATISNSIFSGNLAGGGNGSTANGGAIDNEGGGTTMTVTGSQFFSNKAAGGAYANGETTLGQALGGGIIDAIQATLNISNSVLIGNMSIGGAHGTITTDNPATGAGFGGGIEVGFAQAAVSNCVLFGNVAQGGDTDQGVGANGIGGGIDNSLESTITIDHSAIVGNTAIAGHGGPVSNPVPAGAGIGGGLDDWFFSTATVSNSILAGNQAIGSNAAPGNNGGDGLGGGIAVGLNAYFNFSDDSSVTLTDSTVDGNVAIGGRGGSGGNGGNGWGGGVIVFAGSTATLQDSAVEFNFAIGGHKGTGGSDGQGVGGGTYNLGTLNLVGTTVIKHNYATTSNDDTFG